MKNKIFMSILILAFFYNRNFFPQTKSYGNYEVYTYESVRDGISYLKIKFNAPFPNGKKQFSQTGFLYSHQSYLGEIGSYVFNGNAKLRIISESNFNIGFAFGESLGEVSSDNPFNRNSTFYLAKIDFYTYDIAAEFTYVLKEGYAITGKFGMELFSFGFTAGLPKKGNIQDHAFGVMNLIPLKLQPQILLDFGRSVVGIGFLIHPLNFVEYRYLPKKIFSGNESGFKFNSSTFEDYALQFWFYY